MQEADNAGSAARDDMEPEEREGQKSEKLNHSNLFTTNTQIFSFLQIEAYSPSKYCQIKSL